MPLFGLNNKLYIKNFHLKHKAYMHIAIDKLFKDIYILKRTYFQILSGTRDEPIHVSLFQIPSKIPCLWPFIHQIQNIH